MLGEATADMWNKQNVLASVLAARALMETGAILWDFVARCQKAYEAKDLSELNRTADATTFATRLPKWVAEDSFTKSVNVLTLLGKLDKGNLKGVCHHYESLSEFCHPNYLGSLSAFGKIDYQTGNVSYSRTKIFNNGMLSHVLGRAFMLGRIEIEAEKLEQLIPKVAVLQDALEPLRPK